jgi:hypothetical protein
MPDVQARSLAKPQTTGGALTPPAGSPQSLIRESAQAMLTHDEEQAERLLNQATAILLQSSARVNRHRLFVQAALAYVQLGEHGEAARCFRRALGVAVQSDSPEQVRALPELLECYATNRQWRLAAQTFALMALEPRTWKIAVHRLISVCKGWLDRTQRHGSESPSV